MIYSYSEWPAPIERINVSRWRCSRINRVYCKLLMVCTGRVYGIGNLHCDIYIIIQGVIIRGGELWACRDRYSRLLKNESEHEVAVTGFVLETWNAMSMSSSVRRSRWQWEKCQRLDVLRGVDRKSIQMYAIILLTQFDIYSRSLISRE